jgi:hypothetical protein
MRAETIIDEEACSDERSRERRRSDWFPDFLQVLQCAEPKETVWSGVGGQIASGGVSIEAWSCKTKLID